MKISILLIFSFLAFSGFSQELELETSASVTGSADGTLKYDFTITNVGATTAEFYWELVKGQGVPSGWDFQICDANLCYEIGTELPPCDLSGMNKLAPGVSINYFKVEVFANDIAGNHDIIFRIIDDCSSSVPNIIEDININFNATSSSNVDEILNDNIIVLYPNPTANRFQINKDDDIASISIFNIVGKNIKNLSHRPGQSHDVSDLEHGFYLVRMLDRNQNTLKVIRLTKD